MVAAVDLRERFPALIGKQQHVYEHIDRRINIATGSVRSGKTVSTEIAWLKWAAAFAPPGDLLMVGKTLAALERNVINPLLDLAAPYISKRRGMSGGYELYIGKRRVYLVGANDERSEGKIRGMTLAGAYGDEITLWPESFFNMLLSRLSLEGAAFIGTTNPDSPAHWLKKKYLDRRRELDMRVWEFTLEDNPHLPPSYVDSLKKEYVGLWYRRYILGQWVAAEGAVFDMLDPAIHFVDTLPKLSRSWLPIDYGTTNPTTWAYLSLGVDNCLYVHHSYRHDSRQAHRQKTDAEYSRDLMTHLRENAKRGIELPENVWYDPSAASFGLQIWRDFRKAADLAGVRISTADNEVLDGIRDVASLFAAGLIKIHRPSVDTGMWDELVGYSWDEKAQERGEDKPIKSADHAPDMIRYGVRGSKRYWRHMVAA